MRESPRYFGTHYTAEGGRKELRCRGGPGRRDNVVAARVGYNGVCIYILAA